MVNEFFYVMDGKVILFDVFMIFNFVDIQEIKVLKDVVVCVLYGIKVVNGVIEIIFQCGNFDGRLIISYSFNIGIIICGCRGVKMMDSEEKLELERCLQNILILGY